MGFNIGPTITVQGEAQFNAAMVQMRQNMKYVNAEANAAMSIFDKNEKSVGSLTAKNESLTKALDVQRKGEEEARKQLEALVKNGLDPASEKYKQLKANLDNVTASANQTEREIKENKEAMAGLKESSTGLGSAVQEIAGKFGINLPSGLTKSMDSIGGIDAKMLTLAGTMAAVGIVIAKIEEKLIEVTLKQAAAADDIMTMAMTSGMTTDRIQEMNYSAEILDTTADNVSGSMTKMIRSMNAARDGSGDAADAYRQLKVDVVDGNKELRDANVVFYEVIDKLGSMKNETDRDALSMQIFGKSARELNPLIEAGSARLKELAAEAHNVGYVMDTETLTTLGAVDDAMQRFNKQMEKGENVVSEGMAPALERLLTVGSGTVDGLTDLVEESGLIELFAALLDILSALGPVFDILFDTAKRGTGPIKALAVSLAIVADALTIVVNVVAIAIEAFKQLFNLMTTGRVDNRKFNEYWGNLKRVFSSEGATARAMNSINSVPRYARGTQFHPGGPAVINDGAGPELVDLPRGSKVYSFEQTKMMLAGAGGGDVFHITIDAKNVREFNDVVQMAKSAQQDRRAGRK